MKIRICHVITKPELGGAQLSTLNLLSIFPKDRYEISLITSPKGILGSEFKNLKNVRCFFSSFLVRYINPIFDLLALAHIYYIYRCNSYEIVHTHSSKAGIIGRWAAILAKTPFIVHTVHGWSFNDYQPMILKKFFIFIERIAARWTARLVCVSKNDLEIGLKYKIAPEEKFVLIRYGIPLGEVRNSSTDTLQKRKEFGITNNDPVIGMISCLKPQKSPLDYIEAAISIYKKMPNINFLLVGDGVLMPKCKRKLSGTDLNGRFIFTGWRRDVPEILDILDILVLTSKWEGLPISLIEGLSKGCPVVATNVGGIPELVKDGETGYITEPGAFVDIAEKVMMLLRDRESFNRMKKQAFLSIDDSFRLERMANEVDTLYRSFK